MMSTAFYHHLILRLLFGGYLGYKGMSLIQIGVLESISQSCNFIFEIPSGAMTD